MAKYDGFIVCYCLFLHFSCMFYTIELCVIGKNKFIK